MTRSVGSRSLGGFRSLADITKAAEELHAVRLVGVHVGGDGLLRGIAILWDSDIAGAVPTAELDADESTIELGGEVEA